MPWAWEKPPDECGSEGFMKEWPSAWRFSGGESHRLTVIVIRRFSPNSYNTLTLILSIPQDIVAQPLSENAVAPGVRGRTKGPVGL